MEIKSLKHQEQGNMTSMTFTLLQTQLPASATAELILTDASEYEKWIMHYSRAELPAAPTILLLEFTMLDKQLYLIRYNLNVCLQY